MDIYLNWANKQHHFPNFNKQPNNNKDFPSLNLANQLYYFIFFIIKLEYKIFFRDNFDMKLKNNKNNLIIIIFIKFGYNK